MTAFKKYLEEQELQSVHGWGKILKENPALHNAIALLGEIEKIEHGAEALITGGAVRDIVLGDEAHDIDITTNVDIDKIEAKFRTHDIGKSKDFGIVVVIFNDHTYEVAQYRADEGFSNSRHPDKVTKVKTFKADSARRDLTINSLGLNKHGEIIDYQGGLKDIENKIVRTVGKPQERFEEDALRILRVARFASRLGFKIDDDTEAAMASLGHTIDNVSRERMAEELYKAAGNGSHLAEYIIQLDKSGILERVLPEVSNLKSLMHNVKHHPEGGDTPYGAGSVLGHVVACLRASRSSDALVNVAILLHDIGKGKTAGGTEVEPTYLQHEKVGAEMIAPIAKRLHFSNTDANAFRFAAEKHMNIHLLPEMKKSKIVKLVNDPHWELLVDVGFADEAARGPTIFDPKAFNEKIRVAEEIAQEVSQNQGSGGVKERVKELINGNLLMQWIPELKERENRPHMGQILAQTEDWLIENGFAMPGSDQPISQDTVKDYAINVFHSIQNADTFQQFWSADNV